MPASIPIFDKHHLPTGLHFELKIRDREVYADSVDVLTVRGATSVSERRASSIIEIDDLLSLGVGRQGIFAGGQAIRADYHYGTLLVDRYRVLVRTHPQNLELFIEGTALETVLSQLRVSAKEAGSPSD